MPSNLRPHLAAPLALLLVAAVWGSTFPISKDLLTRISVNDYLAVRFALAAFVLALLSPRALRRISRRQAWLGVQLGLIYGVAQWLQFAGLTQAAATVSAFLVSMYVVVTPLLAAVLYRLPVSRQTRVAVVVAASGVMVMSLRGWSFGTGEALTLLSSVLYAVHILTTGRLVRTGDAQVVTVIQMATIAVLSAVPTIPNGIEIPQGTDWIPMLYLALAAGALAMFVQAWAQPRMGVAQASVVMVTEPVWAALFAVVFWQEVLDVRTMIGAALVLTAAALVLLDPRRARRIPTAVGVEQTPDPLPLPLNTKE
ncbi:DMT family transporter [Nocardioides sp. Bht2]|uniref:DMT family transporter n=1 Tax=Nocardioides sp. Bht2 TaxID=3392297 RepID=UPI0039B49B67